MIGVLLFNLVPSVEAQVISTIVLYGFFILALADALILGELQRVRRCADPRCARVFYDGTKNAARRWCDMATCGNRAKAARFRARERDVTPAPTSDISVRPAEARSA